MQSFHSGCVQYEAEGNSVERHRLALTPFVLLMVGCAGGSNMLNVKGKMCFFTMTSTGYL